MKSSNMNKCIHNLAAYFVRGRNLLCNDLDLDFLQVELKTPFEQHRSITSEFPSAIFRNGNLKVEQQLFPIIKSHLHQRKGLRKCRPKI